MNGRIVLCIVLVGAALSLGCASHPAAPESTQVLCPEGITTAQIIEAAHDVLADMHFSFEKLDVEHGFVQTRPLRAGQFFEFWRSDNVGAFDTIEANVQSIRRTVGLRVTTEAPDALSPSPVASGLRIECDVQVQRLALPGNEIAGISQAYMMHTRSQATLQVLDVTPQQRAGMTWIDLGPDPELAAEILKRIEKKLGH
jgi:hypothetical protein